MNKPSILYVHIYIVFGNLYRLAWILEPIYTSTYELLVYIFLDNSFQIKECLYIFIDNLIAFLYECQLYRSKNEETELFCQNPPFP